MAVLDEYEGIPTDYGGIIMKSHTEACFAEMCDILCWSWVYEPFTVTCPVGVYIPDFIISRDGERALWVEIKPTLERALDVRGRVERVLHEYPEASLAVAVPAVVHGLNGRLDSAVHPLNPLFAFTGFYWEGGWRNGIEHGWDGQVDGHVEKVLENGINLRVTGRRKNREVSLGEAYAGAPYTNYRTDVISSVAWYEFIRGNTFEDTLSRLLKLNDECCSPPLPEAEVKAISIRNHNIAASRRERSRREMDNMLDRIKNRGMRFGEMIT